MADGKALKRRTKRKRKEEGQDDAVTVKSLIDFSKGHRKLPSTSNARFNGTASNYIQIVSVEHRDTFTLKPFVVPDGSLAGRKVILLEPIETFRFLDLPPELRIMVYRFVVQKDEYVTMSRYSRLLNSRSPIQRLRKKTPGLRTIRHGRAAGNDYLRVLMRPPPPFAGLLRVSKQILQEAAPIVYDQVSFEPNIRVLGKFLDRIGSMRPHLRHLKLDGSGTECLDRSVWQHLCQARALKIVSFDHADVCGCDRRPSYNGLTIRAQFLRGMDTLVDVFRERRRLRGTCRLPEQILVTVTKCWHCCAPSEAAMHQCTNGHRNGGEMCGKTMAQHCDQLREQIRAYVAAKLAEA